VEDLLQVKRAERPPPEFWARFERELRQKQLAALVERRSWWHGPAAAFTHLGWLRLPVGAMAVLAVTVVSVRQYSPSSRTRGSAHEVAVGDKPSVLVQTAPALPVEAMPVGAAPAVSPSAPAAIAQEPMPKIPEARGVPSDAAPSLQTAGLIPDVAGFEKPATLADSRSFAGPLSIQLDEPAIGDPVLVVAAAQPVGFEERSISLRHSRSAAEVLPTAVAVTEQRRSRLLAALGSAGVYTSELSVPEHAKRSAIRHLAEDGWDRSEGRLEAEADHFSIKF